MLQFHIEYSGAEFNKIYKGIKLYKFLNNDLIHFGFRYEIGLNIDSLPFNPNGECSEGGLYFCEESKCYHFWQTFGKKIATIEIPDDARIYVEKNKFKTNKLVITDITNFFKVPDDFWIMIIKDDGFALQYVKEQTDEICKLAVQQHGGVLVYVKEQTEGICKLAVQRHGYALIYVKKQTDEICKLAVHQNGEVLQYVKEQTNEICILAVKQNGRALCYVKNQTEELCTLAVRQNIKAYRYVNEPFRSIII